MTAKMVSAYLTANDFQHTLLGEDEDVIKTGMGGLDNIDHLELYLFFDEDGSYVHIRTTEYVKIPENLKEKIYPVINELNLNFRWCTFVINTDNELIYIMTHLFLLVTYKTSSDKATVIHCILQFFIAIIKAPGKITFLQSLSPGDLSFQLNSTMPTMPS